MAEQKVSYRYAKAVFETAIADNLIDQMYNDFIFVLKILSSVPELMSIAKKPLISSLRKKKLFREIFANSISEPTLNFILFLVDKNRDYLLKDIILQFQRLYYSFKNYLPVEIYLPRDFEDGIKNKIVNRIELNTGMRVVPKFIIDPKIIGGFKIKIEDWVYDVTLKNKIDSLFKELVSTMKLN